MSDENITDSSTGNAPDKLSEHGEVPTPSTTDVGGSNTPDLSQDIGEMLSSFSPKESTGAGERKERRKVPRFRVGWHAEILIDEQSTLQGFINDISTLGASIYLNSSLHATKCTLHIHIPPLNLKSKPHIVEVSGRIIYVVFDGDKQLFRAAINFIRFHLESDRAYLGERLTKYQLKIPEIC